MTKYKKFNTIYILYCLGLFTLWGVLEIVIMPYIEYYSFSDIIKEVFIKIFVWFIPAVVLQRYFNKFMFVKKEYIFSFKLKSTEFIIILFLFTVFQVISALVQNGGISINDSFRMSDIIIACSVGVSEEMVFRGWLLNSVLNEKNKYTAVIINSLLFLAIHFPVWIREGVFLTYITNGAFLQIIVLSAVFSLTFIRSRNIIIPAILHAYWDFLCFLI
ncbi:MAG: CPBP family intramembrane metalloprotease [Prevotella sp.]|nr:CPBP family intramembrane metalloprotease [Alistipes senegalensis]MCM1357472.1 CPBP family intramembrane metalloprotease [Prevotella sp.]MCM1473018.1 CPBP family intramembrane metalloprotease [Muribaculaceae bacterium]